MKSETPSFDPPLTPSPYDPPAAPPSRPEPLGEPEHDPTLPPEHDAVGEQAVLYDENVVPA